MAKTQFPFTPGDFTKMFSDLKVPGLDPEALVSAQRKNIEAVTAANKVAVDAWQEIARQQTEYLKEAVAQAAKTMREGASASSPEGNAQRQTDAVQEAVAKALATMKSMAEVAAKANAEAFDKINRRFVEGLSEVQGQAGRRAQK